MADPNNPSEAGSCLILGAEADGVGPSVLLTCAGSQRQYLFGAAEGFSRLALECRARPTAKLRAVFLSSFRPRASGGLGGLLLRLCADGHGSVCLAGPPGIGTHVEALRDFVRFRHPEVTALRLVPPGIQSARRDVFAPDDTRACDAAAESYQDDTVMVFPLFAPRVGEGEDLETCRLCAAVDDASAADEDEDEDVNESNETSTSSASVSSETLERVLEPPTKRSRRTKTAPASERDTKEEEEENARKDFFEQRRDVVGYACAIREKKKTTRLARDEDEDEDEDDDDDVNEKEKEKAAGFGYLSTTFLVLDCADDSDSKAAAANATVRCCLFGEKKNPNHPRACAAFHLTPRDVASRPAYDAVRRRSFGVAEENQNERSAKEETSTLHVDCSVAGEVGFRAGARALARLHAVDPETFPLSPPLRAPYRASATLHPSSAGRRDGVRSAEGSLCATVTLFRGGSCSMDQRSNRSEELDVDAVVASALSRLRVANKEDETDEKKNTSSSHASSAPSLLFLGTGSAEPSKYRGSSGVLVKLPGAGGTRPGTGTGTGTGGDGGYALLDCGEGVAGATRRFLGDDEGGRVLDELRFVFITHHHPDHMAGLLGVLAARSPRAPPLPVLGPSATARWLRRAVEVGAVGEGPKTWTKSARDVDDGVARLAAFARTASLYARENGGGGPFWIPPKNGIRNVPKSVSTSPTPMTSPPRFLFPPPPPLPPLPPPRHPLCASLGLSRLEAVPVEHCPEASAVILAHPSGFSLCYSGDCRPSRRLAAAARGVQVLVHEATFADDLQTHAERKRHSTVSEALRVAGETRAGATILTHFSQRYPKALGVNGETEAIFGGDEKNKISRETVVCAFDGMRVRWDALGNLAETARRVDAMFETVSREDPDARSLGGADQ